MSGTIGREEFEQRLVALCLGGGTGMPRRHRDQHILLASATLSMEIGAVYSEGEINSRLRDWLDGVCPAMRLDQVTLRRELIDRSYLMRHHAGTNYSIGPGTADVRFDPELGSVDPLAMMEAARAERAARKAAHLGSDG